MTAQAALAELVRHAGSQFDQCVVEALVEAYPQAEAQINGRLVGLPRADAEGEARAAAQRMSDSGSWRVVTDDRVRDVGEGWAGV
jgi:hypothetical protein